MGIIESVLHEVFGNPHIVSAGAYVEYRWNETRDGVGSVLYKGSSKVTPTANLANDFAGIYGEFLGGVLLRNVLKVATIHGAKIFGLYRIDELRQQPEVMRASALDPDVNFFMDSANVRYYGFKNSRLYAYDSTNDELSELGHLYTALLGLLDEWTNIQ